MLNYMGPVHKKEPQLSPHETPAKILMFSPAASS